MVKQDDDVKDEFLIRKSVSTIYNEMNKLRMSPEEEKGRLRQRWIWELIQNAVDCHREKTPLDIEVKYDGNSKLTFSHNGKGFRERDLWSIVTQTSSKQEDEDSTGQFGTGFVTTSLLSPKIHVRSFLEDDGKAFDIILDRSGTTIPEITESVKKNFDILNNLFTNYNYSQNIDDKTYFQYDLNDSLEPEIAKAAINNGLDNLIHHMPYLLVFSKKINTLTINNQKFKLEKPIKIEALENAQIEIISNSMNLDKITILHYSFKQGTFAAPIYYINNYYFLEINKEVAKLNCTFPLVGTEKFPFPLVLNSPFFEVEMDRNAVYESSDINMVIMEEAIKEYNKFLDHYSQYSCNINYICSIEKEKSSQFKNNIKNKILDIIFNKKMVQTTKGFKMSILDEEGDKQIIVPHTINQKFETQVYDLLSTVPTLNIPVKETVELWRPIIDNNLNLSEILKKQISNNTLTGFKKWYGSEDVLSWLNNFYKLSTNISKDIVSLFALPNQKEDFILLSNLSYYTGEFFELMEILFSLNEGRKNDFVMTGIELSESMIEKMKIFNNMDISNEIENHVVNILAREKMEKIYSRNPKIESIFSDITKFFFNHPEESITLFPVLYPDRANLRSINYAEELTQLGDFLSENNLSMVEAQEILSKQEIIDIILNSDDGTVDVISKLQHTSVSSPRFAQFVRTIIQRSIKNVYEALNKNSRYVVPTSLEDWQADNLSSTVFRAKKDGTSIIIVIRPSDGNKIIFYENEEISALSGDNFELWTDNGTEVLLVTLGDLLQTTNITVIPLRNLFLEE